MIRRLYFRLYWWAHRISEKQRMRKRLATLEQQLARHDKDIVQMAHFPKPVQERMLAYRARLTEQIEIARKFI